MIPKGGNLVNQEKIGRFIAERRRLQGLTQMQLGEMLGITDRAVSKWENGRSMPDPSVMIVLCEILNISVNDLLYGEIISMDNYKEKSDELILELAKQKAEADKKMLALEVLIGMLSTIILLGFSFIAAFIPMAEWQQIVLVVVGFVIGLVGLAFAIRIEQTAGYYECRCCHHKHVPKYASVLWAMHFGRTRYMSCPECKKWSWQKKVITKD